jgi:hypothetical protein
MSEFDLDPASIDNDESKADGEIATQHKVKAKTDISEFDLDAASIDNDKSKADGEIANKLMDGIDDAQMLYGESKVEEKLANSFEQIAADAILMMSDDTDVLTVSVYELNDRHIVDLVQSSTQLSYELSWKKNQPGKDDVLFVYPFVGVQAIENATIELFLFQDCLSMPTVLLQLQKQACEPKKSFVTVIKHDREWFCDGGWLNDNIINFWLQWVTRMESHPDSSIHTMITFFYTKLESILHWTTKNNNFY